MIKIYQEIVDADNGDCLRACICSLLGLENTSVIPNFGDYPDNNFWIKVNEWTKPNIGYSFIPAMYSKMLVSLIKGFYCIAVGPVHRGPQNHAVIIADEKIIHDPHPSNAGLIEISYIVIPVFIGFYQGGDVN